jgi:hypothetical protein
MGSKSTKKAKDKKILDQQKSNKSIDKLKKKKKTVSEEKISAEKKLKKLKEKKGKKGKLKKLKELLTKLLKKEEKVALKLRESKKNKSAAKDKKEGEKTKRTDKKMREKRANRTEVDLPAAHAHQDTELAVSNKQTMEESPAQPLNHSSVDHLAKEAIAHVRKLNSVHDIDLFVLGDKRSTVLKAAQSRKNSLARK